MQSSNFTCFQFFLFSSWVESPSSSHIIIIIFLAHLVAIIACKSAFFSQLLALCLNACFWSFLRLFWFVSIIFIIIITAVTCLCLPYSLLYKKIRQPYSPLCCRRKKKGTGIKYSSPKRRRVRRKGSGWAFLKPGRRRGEKWLRCSWAQPVWGGKKKMMKEKKEG